MKLFCDNKASRETNFYCSDECFQEALASWCAHQYKAKQLRFLDYKGHFHFLSAVEMLSIQGLQNIRRIRVLYTTYSQKEYDAQFCIFLLVNQTIFY